MSGLDPGVPILGETALADRVHRDRAVLVLFYANWCPFCRRFVPIFADRTADLPVSGAAADVSHPEDPRWDAYGIETIPTLVSFQAGRETARLEAESGVGLSGDELDAFLATLWPVS